MERPSECTRLFSTTDSSSGSAVLTTVSRVRVRLGAKRRSSSRWASSQWAWNRLRASPLLGPGYREGREVDTYITAAMSSARSKRRPRIMRKLIGKIKE